MEYIKWRWREVKRLKRLLFPEPSIKLLVKIVGPFWLWRRGARREFKIKLWSIGHGWYCPDIALPHKKLAVEADGAPHFTKQGMRRDIVRDQRLRDKGWQILRVSYKEMRDDPRHVRKRVRNFLR